MYDVLDETIYEALLRVVRAAEEFIDSMKPLPKEATASQMLDGYEGWILAEGKLKEALEALPPHLRGE